MANLHHLILLALDNAAQQLIKDLEPLKQQMLQDKEGMFVTDDGTSLVVYAPFKYKAYIPKKYRGFDVKFITWDGEELQLDLNVMICND